MQAEFSPICTQLVAQPYTSKREASGTSTSKAGRRRPIQIDALAGGNLSLTAHWQMNLDTTLPFAIPSSLSDLTHYRDIG
jgi:hypothetical protein